MKTEYYSILHLDNVQMVPPPMLDSVADTEKKPESSEKAGKSCVIGIEAPDNCVDISCDEPLKEGETKPVKKGRQPAAKLRMEQKLNAAGTVDTVQEHFNALMEEVAKLPAKERRLFAKANLPILQMVFDISSIGEQHVTKAETSSVPPLPDPDPTGKSYPLYQKRTNPIEHLKSHWGQWLKSFSPELDRDYLFQDELRKRDPVLMRALDHKIRRQGKKVSGVIPPKKARTNAEIKALDIEKRREVTRLHVAAWRRETGKVSPHI